MALWVEAETATSAPARAVQATPRHDQGLVRLMIPEGPSTIRHVLLAIEELGAGRGMVLAANRPAHIMRSALIQQGMDLGRIEFLDCVSSLSGGMPRPEPGIVHVESPTMLEKLAMRCEQMLRAMPTPRFLVVDSLSALAVYNGPDSIAEFTHHLVNRLRRLDVPCIFLASDRQGGAAMCEAIAPLCDGVLRA